MPLTSEWRPQRSTPGYPQTCACGEPTPERAMRDSDFRYYFVCGECKRTWRHWELIGWRADDDPDDGWEDNDE